MTDWTAFASALADELAAAPDTSVLVVGESAPAGSRRFAQFRKSGDSVLAELTGDEWLDSRSRPGEAGWRAITRAGWHQPDQDHCDNWWAEFTADLSYQGWVEKTGSSLHLPSLGIPDAE
ncbi:TY-Chap domain-containing protein [Nocardia neocaledoniensis]|uniref:TY-Chap domain-containing protein n=1 Tax=Nocardia neocaledoniensis TaxID=236511 RepID=UPI0024582A12|nr:hypothetical protein [Nocardia neocaledoniensis]